VVRIALDHRLNGVFLEAAAGTLRAVATHGHRLSLAERALEGDFRVRKGVILESALLRCA
jgi:DNA polymerase III subunit beta